MLFDWTVRKKIERDTYMAEKKQLTVAQKKQRKRKIQNLVRRGIQLAFFLFLPSLFSEAFNGVKGIFRAVGQGEVLAVNDFVKTFIIICVITLVCGRYFCGYACAFGTLGDAVHGIAKWIQKKLKVRFPKIPEKVCIHLQIIKYVNLLVILITCVLGVSQVIESNSPWQAFSRIRMLDFKIAGYWIGFVCFMLIIVGMFFEERFFCQFLCPLGAIFSLLPILPWANLKRKEGQCIKGCNACQKQCPVHHKLDGISVRSNECIQCGRCKLVCPKGNISLRNVKQEKVKKDIA